QYETARLAYEAVSHAGPNGVTVSAPVSGYVQSCMVTDGAYVSVGQPLMTISKNNRLYLKAEVPEADYAALGKITSAKFKTSYSPTVYDISDMNGRMLAYGRASDAASSYIPVTFEFNNSKDIIPGSYAEIYLLTELQDNVISVPVSALTEEQGVLYVYLKLDADCYRKQEVTKGMTDGERVEILAGLHPGDVVVTEGAIHIKLASVGKSIPGHTHNH
ncbi:MAG: efflux RND transporter periplasmic adaptor subunit, partial [Muribaculaceae bacterium]|nr:efflux RND transporter periplasmic adaptor subunit [Muribaculaceae bacterium]